MTAISAAIVGVPDQILSPYCVAGHTDGLRRALPAIEEGLGGSIEWDLYANISPEAKFEHARRVYGKRFTSSQRRLFS